MKIKNLDLRSIKEIPVSQYLTVKYDTKNNVYTFCFTKDCNIRFETEGDFEFSTKGNLLFESSGKMELTSIDDDVFVYGKHIHLKNILNKFKEDLLKEIKRVDYV